MKTSSKLIIAAGVFFLGSIVWYNSLLKSAYDTGKYKQPFATFTSQPFKDFDRVEMTSSTATNVHFVQGPFSVRVDNNASRYARFHQSGKTLVIDAEFERNYQWNPNPYVIIVSCPHLAEVKAGATYLSGKHPVTDTVVRADWMMREVLIEGFREDSLRIVQDYGSTVTIARCDIGSLNATVGLSPGSGSKLVINKDNRFGVARLDIRNNSHLSLDDATIGSMAYHLEDSAAVIAKGRALHLLSSSKPFLP